MTVLYSTEEMSITHSRGTSFLKNNFGQFPRPRADNQEESEGKADTRVEEGEIVPGRIFWLPSEEQLPAKSVRVVKGKGGIQDGIFSHPVVITSRPAEGGHMVHFHLITSLQGKTIDQLYNRPTEFHASRRSWFLPIAPTPDHPDANSKATKRRFPTLKIAHGAALRCDSYVNIRNVYEVDWTCLKTYASPNCATTRLYCLERESMVRMLAKSKTLTNYEPGPQFQSLSVSASAKDGMKMGFPTSPRAESA